MPGGDQDHALVLAAPDAPGQAVWARGLAERIEGALAADGVPRCPGGFHASRWTVGLDALCARARGWLDEPTPERALEAAAFLDARPVAGELELAPLRAVLALAPGRPRFLGALARGALSFRPPGRLRLALRRALGGALDPKREALAPIVLTARALGAAAGTGETGTVARLEAAGAADLLDPEVVREAVAAFRRLVALRAALRPSPGAAAAPPPPAARRSAEGGAPPGVALRALPGVSLRALPRADLAALHRALAAARRLQDAAARRLGVE